MGFDIENRRAVDHIRVFYENDILMHGRHRQYGKTDGIRPKGRADIKNPHGTVLMLRVLNQIFQLEIRAFVKMENHHDLLPGTDVL